MLSYNDAIQTVSRTLGTTLTEGTIVSFVDITDN